MRLSFKSILIGIALTALLISMINFLRNPLNQAFLESSYWKNLIKMESTLRIINGYYLHQEDVNYSSLADSAIKGMTYRLDRYSEYVAPSDFESFSKENLGEYRGIGIMLDSREGEVTITEVIPDSPAFQAGLKESDQITHINNISVKSMERSRMLSLFHSAKNDKIEISVWREEIDSEPLSFDVKIQKKVITIDSVVSKKLDGNDIGYIRILQFTEKSVEDFKASIAHFMSQGTNKLVLDLRDNPGGLLDVAVKIADLFHAENEVILTINSRNKMDNTQITASSEFIGNLVQLVILVNRNTCSSAELLAGSLRQALGAPLVGETTFGKGSIQNIFSIDEKTALKLTSANYLLADGTAIDEVGLKPDYPVLDTTDTSESELQSIVGIRTAEPGKEDMALEKAIQLLRLN